MSIIYYSNEFDALNGVNPIAVQTSSLVVGQLVPPGDTGSTGITIVWIISTNSSGGSSVGKVINGTLLDSGMGLAIYRLYPVPPLPVVPYGERECPAPPYNATNFTPANSVEFNTLVNYAKNSPNYPWNTGTDAQQIYRSRQNVSYFNTINQQTQAIKSMNGSTGTIPYPQFKTQAERLMYIQGQALTAARNKITGQNPSAPAGVPCSTIYGIISS